ncbi:MAG TPA: dsRBD fold-containing protein [Euzebya sp.]|nr:dsRBD fold-containing protein [Euzebya sp.]
MVDVKTWTAEVTLQETEDWTVAVATLRMGDAECSARGEAHRNPADPNVPRIGEELATARALGELSGKLLQESAKILEGALGRHVELPR